MIARWLLRFEPFRLGAYENRWLWAHVLGGALAGRALRGHLATGEALALVLLGALVVELVELWREGTRPYRSRRAWAWDTAFDLIGGPLAAGLAL